MNFSKKNHEHKRINRNIVSKNLCIILFTLATLMVSASDITQVKRILLKLPYY